MRAGAGISQLICWILLLSYFWFSQYIFPSLAGCGPKDIWRKGLFLVGAWVAFSAVWCTSYDMQSNIPEYLETLGAWLFETQVVTSLELFSCALYYFQGAQTLEWVFKIQDSHPDMRIPFSNRAIIMLAGSFLVIFTAALIICQTSIKSSPFFESQSNWQVEDTLGWSIVCWLADSCSVALLLRSVSKITQLCDKYQLEAIGISPNKSVMK